MKRYVIKRTEVCAGRLMMSCNPTLTAMTSDNREIQEKDFERYGIPKISVSCGIICRSMLFNVDENNLANDLIYTTPTKYDINGIESNLNNRQSRYYIDNYIELDELLKYLKYGVDLTQHDLDKIYYKLIIHDYWLSHHMKLFGWKKCGHRSYVHGDKPIINKRIYDHLSSISCSLNGTPHPEEPGYQLIKKRK